MIRLTRFNVGFIVIGLLAGVLIGATLGRLTVTPKTVTKLKPQTYYLEAGQSVKQVVKHLGTPVAQKQATASNPFSCVQYVGHMATGTSVPSDWYAIYCFRTR